MMTDLNAQQQMDPNLQMANVQERHNQLQKLLTRWSPDVARKVEEHSFTKSKGILPIYLRTIEGYEQQLRIYAQNRTNPQRQQQQQMSIGTNEIYSNPSVNLNDPQSTSSQNSVPSSLSAMLNQPIRLPSAPQQQQYRMLTNHQTLSNPQSTLLNTQSPLVNTNIRLPTPNKTNQPLVNSMSFPSSTVNSSSPMIPTVDVAKNYSSQPATNRTHFPSQTNNLSSPFATQSIHSRAPPPPHPSANQNGNFLSHSSLSNNNSNDILHQYVLGNPSNNVTPMSSTSNPMNSNSSPTGDRLLQQILSANADGTSNKTLTSNRSIPLPQSSGPTMNQPIRSPGFINNSNTYRPPLTSVHSSPSPTTSMVNINPSSSIQLPTSTSVMIQQSPLNTNQNNAFPVNRPSVQSVTGPIVNPDEEILSLIKYLKENVTKLHIFAQKFFNDGNESRARDIQTFQQQMIQFIQNPTYEVVPRAKQIRAMLERALNRSIPQPVAQPQPQPQPQPPVTPQPQPAIQSAKNEFHLFEKALTEFLSRDQRKRSTLTKFFIEPLSDVLNGVPHKRIRLDADDHFNSMTNRTNFLDCPQSFLKRLEHEINDLPGQIFSIERSSDEDLSMDEEHLNKNGIILRCKLMENSHPLVPPLRLKISTRYPDEQPEILSITDTTPPKLEFTDGHPFFEQMSTYFISRLFQLRSQYTITDILTIWRQSVEIVS